MICATKYQDTCIKCKYRLITVLKTLRRKEFLISLNLNLNFSSVCNLTSFFFRPVDDGGFSMMPLESDLESLQTLT